MLDPRLHPAMRRGTILEIILTIYLQMTITVSMTASFALAVCRLINIKYPFYSVHKIRVHLGCSATVMFQMILQLLYSSPLNKTKPEILWTRYSAQAAYFGVERNARDEILYQLKIVGGLMLTITGFFASITTIIELNRSLPRADSSRENIKKSSKVIAVMNIYNLIMILSLAACVRGAAEYPIFLFLASVGLGMIGAGFNPLIRILACKDIFKYCMSLPALRIRHMV